MSIHPETTEGPDRAIFLSSPDTPTTGYAAYHEACAAEQQARQTAANMAALAARYDAAAKRWSEIADDREGVAQRLSQRYQLGRHALHISSE